MRAAAQGLREMQPRAYPLAHSLPVCGEHMPPDRAPSARKPMTPLPPRAARPQWRHAHRRAAPRGTRCTACSGRGCASIPWHDVLAEGGLPHQCRTALWQCQRVRACCPKDVQRVLPAGRVGHTGPPLRPSALGSTVRDPHGSPQRRATARQAAQPSAAITCRSRGDPRKSPRRGPPPRSSTFPPLRAILGCASPPTSRGDTVAAGAPPPPSRRRPRSLWLAHPPSQSTHCARDNPRQRRAGVGVFRVGSVIFVAKRAWRARARVSGPSVCRSHRARSGVGGAGGRRVDRHRCLRDAAAQ